MTLMGNTHATDASLQKGPAAASIVSSTIVDVNGEAFVG
jgi:hypothetical protein